MYYLIRVSLKKTNTIGIVLLLISIIVHIYLGYFVITSRSVYDELVSWFHIYVINSIKSESFKVEDYALRYLSGRNLLQSPVLLDFFLALLSIEPGLWTLLISIVFLIILYFTTRLITGSDIVAGFSSLLVSTTPCFNYWFKYNIYGAYTLQPFFYMVFILLYYGFIHGSTKLILAASLLGSLLWFTWSDGWLILLIYSVFVSALLFKNILVKYYLYPIIVFLTTTLPLNLIIGYNYITFLHVFSYLTLLMATLFICLIIWFRDVLGPYSKVSINIASSISIFVISFYLVFILSNYFKYPGLMEDYSAVYNPLFDYGVIGLLSLLAIITIIRSRVLKDIRTRFLDFILVSSFTICLVLAYFIQPLSVISTASITPYISLSIISIGSIIYRAGTGRLKIVYLIITIWLVTGSIVSSAIPSYAVSRYSPLINIVDIPRELVRKIVVTESGFINALYSLRNIDNDKLIICYWRYSYWVLGLLGSNTHTLADIRGDEDGWRAYSWIILSDELTAYELIKKIVGNNTGLEVYIVVSEIISIDLTVSSERKVAELGEAIVVPTTAPGQVADVTYQVHGDIARIPQYISIAGFKYSDYLSARGIKYPHEYSMTWTFRTLDTLLVKLFVHGLDNLGYDVFNSVYNRIYGERVLNNEVEKPVYFKLINATVTPLHRIDRDLYSYQICLYVALYKVEL